jgi:hypothetical protein
MTIKIGGKSYVMPKENGTSAPTGKEIVEIENYFSGLDGLTLLGTLSVEEGKERIGYTKVKALYALAWICMVRAGEVVSIGDVLETYGIDEIMAEDSLPKVPALEEKAEPSA